ncbi:hypothetical protein HHK36_027815 [Tetracentron sinense]|uniref:Uncharacterized protein n=1 Tax=Tetracentron sinense TaxID=13715 RepID=A0A834YDV2_TETSI|nr:hypothetical protein HHK36_027815 [Tetracentron sinense]
MEIVTEGPPLTDLVAVLEQATLMAQHLPSTTDPSQIQQACSSLQNARHHLGAFLARFQSPEPHADENSVSSAAVEDEPMQDGDDEAEAEGNSKFIMDKVEERMRNCVLQNKRRKLPLLPSSVPEADQRHSNDNELIQPFLGFDPQQTRSQSFDLVFQFHG